MAEAATVAKPPAAPNRPARVWQRPIKSTRSTRQTVRAQAAEAVRLGQIPSGERSI
jgi:hypothetical protein